RQRIETIEDPDRRAALADELEAVAGRAWLGAATSAGDWAEFREAVRLADSFGIERATVPGRIAYRWAVLDLQDRAASGVSADDGMDRAAQLAGTIRATGLGDAGSMAELDGLLSGEPTGPVFDPAAAGPGLAGWTG